MDFLNKAKDLLQDDNKSQQQSQQQPQQSQQQGGQSFLPPGNKAQGGAYGLPGGDDDDFRSAADEANKLAGSHGDKDLFSSILGSLGQNKSSVEKGDVDESSVLDSFKKFASGGSDGGQKADEQGLGAAAAMQALKLFNSGETKGQKDTQGGFLALAMAEASKLFDDKQKEGKVQEGTSKQGVIQQAGEVAMKLYMKSQLQKQGGEGLAGLASKFLK